MPDKVDKRKNYTDYEVGYGKPPVHSQFKKGQSGNPSGKPKTQKSLAHLLEEESAKEVKVHEGGAEKTITKKELMVKSLIAKACKGDLKSVKFIEDQLSNLDHENPMVNFSWDEE